MRRKGEATKNGLRVIGQIAAWSMAMLLIGCAGFQRGCASCNAANFGSDWIIVQYTLNVEPTLCWKLNGVSVTNEKESDGIYWLDNHTGNLVHISGWYNRVQVIGGNFDAACASLGVDCRQCQDGIYGPASGSAP